MKKILVVKGESADNVLRVAADQIAAGFAARGYETEQLDLDEHSNAEAFAIMAGSYSFIFSCQAIGFEVIVGEMPLLQMFPSPNIGWIFDDVIYHESRVRNAYHEKAYLLTIDKECGRAIQKMYPKTHYVGCLHHGGFCATGTGERAAEEAFWSQNKKDIEVLFPANLKERPPFEQYVENASKIEGFLAKKTVELLKRRPYLAIRKALELVLGELGEELTGELLLEMKDMIAIVNLYIRWQSRYNVLVALLKAGIQVTVVGVGETYEQLAEEYPKRLHLLGQKDILETVQFMARSKIVMNPCAIYAEGLHERLFTAMLCKAVCFTPWNPYLETNFGNCFGFMELDNLDKTTQEIQYILEHPETVERQIEENYAYAMESHTWKQRGEEIIDFYESQIAPRKE